MFGTKEKNTTFALELKHKTMGQELKYTTRYINSNWKIKVSGTYEGRKVHTLVGVAGLLKLVGAEMANKLIERAIKSYEDKQECKLRRGLKITFYTY